MTKAFVKVTGIMLPRWPFCRNAPLGVEMVQSIPVNESKWPGNNYLYKKRIDKIFLIRRYFNPVLFINIITIFQVWIGSYLSPRFPVEYLVFVRWPWLDTTAVLRVVLTGPASRAISTYDYKVTYFLWDVGLATHHSPLTCVETKLSMRL